MVDPSRPPAWSKIPAIKAHLGDHEWLFWTDVDTLVMNPNRKLEDFIDMDYDMIISEVREWTGEVGVNTGNFLIRNTPWAVEFLDAVWAQTNMINHPWWEQQGMRQVLKTDPSHRSHIKVIPQREINAFPDYTPSTSPEQWYQQGDFVVHLAGCGSRRTCMQEFERFWPHALQ